MRSIIITLTCFSEVWCQDAKGTAGRQSTEVLAVPHTLLALDMPLVSCWADEVQIDG